MGYLGLTPTTAQQNYLNIDDISGSFNGSTTSFALLVGGVAPTPFPVTNSCLISVGGVVQEPDDTGSSGFRISGGNIVFSSAPGTGENFFGLVLAGADYLNVGANFPDGTVGTPSITFASDLNTGIYHPSADSIAITNGGTASITIDSNRRVGIGTSSPARNLVVNGGASEGVVQITNNTSGTTAANGFELIHFTNGETQLLNRENGAMVFSTNDTQRMRIDSAGNVGIGTTSPAFSSGDGLEIQRDGTACLRLDDNTNSKAGEIYADSTGLNIDGRGTGAVINFDIGGATKATLDNSGRLLVGTSSAIAGKQSQQRTLQIAKAQAGTDQGAAVFHFDAGGQPPNIELGLSKNNTLGSHTAVGSGDNCGSIKWSGSDGTGFVELASINGVCDGATGTNDMPGRLVFSTTADGASSPTERLRIANNGAWGLAGANYGSSSQVLTSNGSGSAPTWQAAPTPAALSTATGSAPSYSARAWVNFNGTGTVAIRGSANVSSITDNGTGNYTLNFTTAMPDANYSVTGTSSWDTTGGEAVAIVGPTTNGQFNTSGVRVSTRNPNNSGAFDPSIISVAIFR